MIGLSDAPNLNTEMLVAYISKAFPQLKNSLGEKWLNRFDPRCESIWTYYFPSQGFCRLFYCNGSQSKRWKLSYKFPSRDRIKYFESVFEAYCFIKEIETASKWN